MPRVCWAREIGGCVGRISGEHIFTDALFEGTQVRVEGAPWHSARSVTIGRASAVSNVLCRGHNSLLGRGPDKTAIRLRRLLLLSNDPLARPGSQILQRPPECHLSGVSYGQWLCKTHCNVMAASGSEPHPTYVRYAFGRRVDERLWFYHPHQVGDKVTFGESEHQAVARYIYHVNTTGDVDAFSISLCGFSTLVSRVEIGFTRNDLMQCAGVAWADRVSCLQWPTDLGWYRIHFSWHGDPCPGSDGVA